MSLFSGLANLWAQPDSLSYEELVELARQYGLDSRGNRLVLEARLGELTEVVARESTGNPAAGQTLAEVQKADSAGYRRLDSGDELELQGDVVITVDDRDFSLRHFISADLIIYNQQLRQLSAEGNVDYRMEGEEGQQDRFSGERLLFLLDENETLFVSGSGQAENSSDSDAASINRELGGREIADYRFSASFITRNQNNVIIMDNGSISSGRSPGSPYYRIDFTKLWILSPGEWGVDGARLFVGNIPLFAFPFMYLPGNEVIFHPVFIYSGARGYGLNSTSYLAGRRESSESPFSFLQMTDEVQAEGQSVMGIFLQPDNSETPDTWISSTFETLKVIADLYSIRGVSLGLQGTALPEVNPGFDFTVALGFTREIFSAGGADSFTSSYVDDQGQLVSLWHSSYLFDNPIPFRFLLDLNGSWTLNSLRIDLGLPIYSDPFFYSEFTERSEQMPWTDVLLGGSSDQPGLSYGSRGMSWNLRAGYSPSLPEFFRPLISSIRLNNFVSSFDWQIVDNPAVGLANLQAVNSPERSVYAARQFQYPSGSVNISGTILRVPFTAEAMQAEPVDSAAGVFLPPDDLTGDGADSPVGESESQADGDNPPVTVAENTTLFSPAVPAPALRLSRRVPSSYSLGYSLSNSHFYTDIFHGPSESENLLVKYNSFQDTLSANVNQQLSLLSGVFSLTTRGTYAGSFRVNSGFSEIISDTERESLLASALNQERQTVRVNQTATFNLLTWLYGEASLSLTHTINLNALNATRDENGDWELQEIGWDPETVTSHRLGLNYSSPLGLPELNHRATINYDLPPRDQVINANYAIGIPRIMLNVGGGLLYDEGEVEFRDVNGKLDLKPVDWLNADSAAEYSIENTSFEKISFGLGLFTYRFDIEWADRTILELNPERTAWIQTEGTEFSPSRMTHAVNIPLEFVRSRQASLTGSVGVNWSQDFIEFTRSRLSSSANVELLIPGFLKVNLRTASSNNQMFRYIPEYNEILGLPDRNLFIDLARSINFFNREDRLTSFFNLQSYSVEVLHDLGDWMARAEYQWLPRVIRGNDGQSQYQLENRFSFFLQWLPITELQNEIDISSISGENEVIVEY